MCANNDLGKKGVKFVRVKKCLKKHFDGGIKLSIVDVLRTIVSANTHHSAPFFFFWKRDFAAKKFLSNLHYGCFNLKRKNIQRHFAFWRNSWLLKNLRNFKYSYNALLFFFQRIFKDILFCFYRNLYVLNRCNVLFFPILKMFYRN